MDWRLEPPDVTRDFPEEEAPPLPEHDGETETEES